MQSNEGLWHSSDVRHWKEKFFSVCVLLDNRSVPSGKGRNKGHAFVTASNEKRIVLWWDIYNLYLLSNGVGKRSNGRFDGTSVLETTLAIESLLACIVIYEEAEPQVLS